MNTAFWNPLKSREALEAHTEKFKSQYDSAVPVVLWYYVKTIRAAEYQYKELYEDINEAIDEDVRQLASFGEKVLMDAMLSSFVDGMKGRLQQYNIKSIQVRLERLASVVFLPELWQVVQDLIEVCSARALSSEFAQETLGSSSLSATAMSTNVTRLLQPLLWAIEAAEAGRNDVLGTGLALAHRRVFGRDPKVYLDELLKKLRGEDVGS
jgi:hypothetical protein